MEHVRGTLFWENANKRQVREVLMRNGISSSTWHEGHARLMSGTYVGPDIYCIDTLTDKAARVTVQGPEEFDVKISSRTGIVFLEDLDRMIRDGWLMAGVKDALDKIVVID